MSKIISYFNDYAEKYYSTLNDRPFYRITHEIVPNDEFLVALEKARRITVAKFVVDKEDIGASDFKDLSGRNDINQNVELVLKPVGKGLSIMSSTIKDYYKKKNKNHIIKRIMVDGQGDLGPIKLDTDSMKTRDTVTVSIDITGVVESKSIYNEFKGILHKYINDGNDSE
jgi:hypothetical protein